MKNFNIFEVHWGGGGGVSRKTNIKWEIAKKGGLGQFVDLRGRGGGLARKRGWCFWGG